MDYILGIDIGTGSTKAVSVDFSGKAVHTEQVSYPIITPQPGYIEQAPEIIWQAFLKVIMRTLEFHKSPPAAIALSSAMHSFLAVDKTGLPITNMITWADSRSAAIATRIHHAAIGESIYKQTGTPIHAMSPLCKISWFREHSPDVFQNTFKFISIKEYVWHNLFGVYEIDHSIASATGLFDIEALDWSPPAMALAGISKESLSIPVSTRHARADLLPAIRLQLSIPEGVPFIIGASDGCCANLGSFAVEPGIAALTIGTSGAIRVASSHPVHNFESMTFNYRLDEKTFICGGPINNGGIALKWYIQKLLQKPLLSPGDYDAVLDETKKIPPGSDGLLFLPYLLGERAPLWNSDACGSFFGITTNHQQPHFTRAVMEGITLALYNISKSLEDSGLPIRQVNVSGGFVHSEEWLQLMADIFGKPIGLLGSEDASAVGAAFLALTKFNILTDIRQVQPESIKVYTPVPKNHDHYRNVVFPMFRNLTQTLMLNMNILAESKREHESDASRTH